MKNILLVLLVGISLFSCSDDDQPTKSIEIVQGSIKGTILDIDTKEPVAGAFITTSPLSSTTTSKDDGTFELPSVGPEVYDIIITHPDYIQFKDKIRVSDHITNNILFTMVSKRSLNTPPDVPIQIYPIQNSTVGSNKLIFRWTATDKDKDSLTYDVYFGKVDEDMQLIGKNIKDNFFEFTYSFVEGVNYQWKLVAKDKYSQTSSDIIQFNYKEKVVVDLPGLIGNWKLDGNAIDSGIYGYDGIEQNVTYVDDRNGKKGNAAYFNGNSSNFSKIIINNNIQLTDAFTISFWLKPDPSLGENGTVGYYECVSKWGGGGAGLASWAVGINKDSKVYMGTFVSSAKTVVSNLNIIPLQWQFIAVTFDHGNVSIYMNSTKTRYFESNIQTPQNSKLNVCIGGRQDQLSSFHGAIDDVYIFNKVLTDQEVLNLFQE